MTDKEYIKPYSSEEYEAIKAVCVEGVRKALKTITSGDIYDAEGHLNAKGYEALERLEGLDLFWICDPKIKLVKEKEINDDN